MFPLQRPRRLRENGILREMVRETVLRPEDFVYPVFVEEGLSGSTEIASMPGQSRHGLESLLRLAEDCVNDGVRALILFGIPKHKDAVGSQAYAEEGIVQQALRGLKSRGFPLLLMGDVCLCEYTSHGHCGMVQGHAVRNDDTLPLLAQTALTQVQAGADVVAPSDMMDGRVAAIRDTLDRNGHETVPIISYAVKYASSFYGPFRQAADSAPQFGDRRSYQMNPANVREGLREARLDVEEGADVLMVKPALAFLDVIHRVKQANDLPVAAYNVSGEYAMVEFAAQAGALDHDRVMEETLLSIKRAGADMIFTYHARPMARLLRQRHGA